MSYYSDGAAIKLDTDSVYGTLKITENDDDQTVNPMERKIAIIDDDPVFCSIMVKTARTRGMEVDMFSSLLDIGFIGMLGRYRGLIVDYNLGPVNGVEIAHYLSVLFGNIPMMLVSSYRRDEIKVDILPACVKGYCHKSTSPSDILNGVTAMLANA